jgi:hypothetical protein
MTRLWPSCRLAPGRTDPRSMKASQTKPYPAPDTSALIPVKPVLAAILPGLPSAWWHMTQALSRLPDPAPWHDLALAILGVLKPLHWRAEGLRKCEAALDELHRSGVIAIPGYIPPPDPVIPEHRPGDYRPKCAWCGKPCKTLRSKYCSRSHSQMAYMARKAAKASS